MTEKQVEKVLIRLPADLLEKIDRLVAERNTDRTKLICSILRNYDPSLDESVEDELRRRIEKLEKEIKKLKQNKG
jgi:metal-responsive CopG/Arc/MetJ family transcriptional regulator